MRITLEPTSEEKVRLSLQHSVILSMPSDDLNATEAVELMRSALIAWGYQKESVDDAMRGIE